MRENFKKSLNALFYWEGGYVNDPNDPGGKTKYGISKRAYPNVDISKLTKKKAGEIYFNDYWEPCGCEDLPAGIDLIVFDTAVNCGTDKSVRILQESVGSSVDGVYGPNTQAAAEKSNQQSAIKEFVARRAVYYGKLAKLDRFGLGWMRRLADMHQRALNLVK